MNARQQLALDQHCRFAFETSQFGFMDGKYSVALTVNSGYE